VPKRKVNIIRTGDPAASRNFDSIRAWALDVDGRLARASRATGSAGGPSDHKVLVDAADATAGYLADKLVAGANTTLTVVGAGADERVQIDAGLTGSTPAFYQAVDWPSGSALPPERVLAFTRRFYASDVPGSVTQVDLSGSGVSPGTYANATVTVDAYGRVTFASAGSLTGDHKVLNGATDTTAGYLSAKVVGGSNVSITTVGTGGNEQLRVSASSSDHRVLVDSSDTTADYLASKLTAGDSISLSVLHPGGNESVKVDFVDPSATVTSTSLTMNTSDRVVIFTGSVGGTVTLPAATGPSSGHCRPCLIVNNSTRNINVAAGTGDSVNDIPNTTLANAAAMVAIPDGIASWRTVGGAFRATSLALSGTLTVGGTATANGRLSANGDQLRVGQTTVLVIAGDVSGPRQDNILVGDYRGIQFGTTNHVQIGNSTIGAGLQIGTASTEKIAFLGGTPRSRWTGQSLVSHLVDADTSPDTVAKINEVVDLLNQVVKCLSAEEGFALMEGPV
jgi:hypothetical protein